MNSIEIKQIIRPGDAVRIIRSNDGLIKEGSLAYVDGWRDLGEDWDWPEGIDITCNPTTPWIHSERSAMVGGGPTRRIFPELLIPTDETVQILHYIKGDAKEGQRLVTNVSEYYEQKVSVRIWEVDLIKNEKRWKEWRVQHPQAQ